MNSGSRAMPFAMRRASSEVRCSWYWPKREPVEIVSCKDMGKPNTIGVQHIKAVLRPFHSPRRWETPFRTT